jgi:hypothetical protein
MQQIADWLEKLGMSEYAERFTGNRIDLSVLPDLTDKDLKDLGAVLGDRRKMLRAISEFAKGPASPESPSCYGIETAGSGASAAHGHVLRPGRLYRDFRKARP